MDKLWLVAKHEYRKIAGKKSFIISTVAIPVLIVGTTVIAALVTLLGMDHRPVGYVDHAAVLQPGAFGTLGDERERVEILPYTDEDAARAALEAGDIQAYYILPAGYLETGTVQQYYLDEEPSAMAQEDFSNFMRANLVRQLPQEYRARVYYGSQLTVRSSDGKREVRSDNFLEFMVPFFAAVFFFIAVLSAGGYMLQAVSDEKENRTMEVLMTTLTPNELIGGKSLGLVAVVLTQIGLWVLTLALAVVIGGRFIPELQGLRVPWTLLGVTALYFLPAYILIAGIMTALGSAVTEVQQGQQIAGLLNLLFTFPMFFVAMIFANPNHPIIVALSLFPTTSFVTILFRWSFTVIPLWQLALSWTLLVVTAVGSIWFAAQVFRLGMLQYGQALTLKGILAALRVR